MSAVNPADSPVWGVLYGTDAMRGAVGDMALLQRMLDVEAALASLPPDFRAAVVLCDIEQLSYEEIAASLGVKLGTVRSRISRGRALLRAALADRAPALPAASAGSVSRPAPMAQPAS